MTLMLKTLNNFHSEIMLLILKILNKLKKPIKGFLYFSSFWKKELQKRFNIKDIKSIISIRKLFNESFRNQESGRFNSLPEIFEKYPKKTTFIAHFISSFA